MHRTKTKAAATSEPPWSPATRATGPTRRRRPPPSTRVRPTTQDAKAGTYAKGRKFRVQCFTDSGQKWYLTSGSTWVRASYVKTSSKVRYYSNV